MVEGFLVEPTEEPIVPVDVIVPVFRDNVALERLLIGLEDGPLLQRMRVVFGEADAIGEALAERYGVAWSRANRAGRAMQMNHGSFSADGEVLLFLHADSRPPQAALDAIEKAVREGAVGGRIYPPLRVTLALPSVDLLAGGLAWSCIRYFSG